MAYGRQGPPYIELVEGAPGSQWDTTGGPRLDHVGYFSHDLDADVATLEEAGLEMHIDGRRYGAPFTYHRACAAGMRVELIDVTRRAGLLASLEG